MPADLLFRQRAGHRDLAAEKIGVRRSEHGNRPACLGEGRRVEGMGVDDSPRVLESPVELEVGRRVRRGPEPAPDPHALEVDKHHVRGPQPSVEHAARLYRDDAARAVVQAAMGHRSRRQPVGRAHRGLG